MKKESVNHGTLTTDHDDDKRWHVYIDANFIRYNGLSQQARMLLLVLRTYIGSSCSVPFPGVRTLCDILGCGEDSYHKYLKELVKEGWVTVTRGRGATRTTADDKKRFHPGAYSSNRYHLLNKKAPLYKDRFKTQENEGQEPKDNFCTPVNDTRAKAPRRESARVVNNSTNKYPVSLVSSQSLSGPSARPAPTAPVSPRSPENCEAITSGGSSAGPSAPLLSATAASASRISPSEKLGTGTQKVSAPQTAKQKASTFAEAYLHWTKRMAPVLRREDNFWVTGEERKKLTQFFEEVSLTPEQVLVVFITAWIKVLHPDKHRDHWYCATHAVRITSFIRHFDDIVADLDARISDKNCLKIMEYAEKTFPSVE